jgi:hypothetical protein
MPTGRDVSLEHRFRKRLRTVAAPIAACVVAASTAARADDWPSYQHDAQHTGLSTSKLDPTTLKYTWSSPNAFIDPLIVGNTVYAIDTAFNRSPGTVESFNLADGHSNWTFQATYDDTSHLAYGGGMLAYTASQLNFNTHQVDTSVYVLNAATGAPLYSVPIPEGTGCQIIIGTDTTTSQPVAYLADGRGQLTAVRLGPTSGTKLWTASGLLAGRAPGSVAGNMILLTEVEHYYAIDRTTGSVKQFYNGPLLGGGMQVPVVDTARKQFYVSAEYRIGSKDAETLTAYSYAGTTITQLWQKQGTGIATPGTSGGGVALGPDGQVISADTSTLTERDPATGNILHSASGSFAAGNTPVVSNGYVFEFGKDQILDDHVEIYRAGDLSPVTTIHGSPASHAAAYSGSGALDDTHFLLANGGSGISPGFEVYTASTPQLPGDANGDGAVNFSDLLVLAQHYGQKNATFSTGDFNNDGSVGFDDLLILAQHYGEPTAGTTAVAVPEPASAFPLGCLGLFAFHRRRLMCPSAKDKSRVKPSRPTE